jgi:hypothetical protein
MMGMMGMEREETLLNQIKINQGYYNHLPKDNITRPSFLNVWRGS